VTSPGAKPVVSGPHVVVSKARFGETSGIQCFSRFYWGTTENSPNNAGPGVQN
jgi:hypothetical protein